MSCLPEASCKDKWEGIWTSSATSASSFFLHSSTNPGSCANVDSNSQSLVDFLREP